MKRITKKTNEINYNQMYTNHTNHTDIVSCYFLALNQLKGSSYTGQYNDIDMYRDLSSVEYKVDRIYEN